MNIAMSAGAKILAAVLAAGLLTAQQGPGSLSGRRQMKTRAGEIVVELPPGWTDSTEYTYFSEDEKLSLRISRLSVQPGATTRALLDTRLHKFSAVGEVSHLATTEVDIKQHPGSYAALQVTHPGGDDDEKLAIRVMVLRINKTSAMAAILTGPALQQTRVDEAWRVFIGALSFADQP